MMTVMTVLEVPDPRLRLVAEPVETVDDSTRTPGAVPREVARRDRRGA